MGAILLREIMSTRFHEIQENFKRASCKCGVKFDYDIFIDTYMKCDEILQHKDVTEEQVLKYFWVAFLNNSKKDYKQKQKITKVNIEEAEEIAYEEYDDRRLIVHETIINYVRENFSEIEFDAWYLHFVENKDYKDLENMGFVGINFHNLFRNINNGIKNKLPKLNKTYKRLIKEIFKN